MNSIQKSWIRIVLLFSLSFIVIASLVFSVDAGRPKGSKNKRHKYIERTGTPGHYKYKYPKNSTSIRDYHSPSDESLEMDNSNVSESSADEENSEGAIKAAEELGASVIQLNKDKLQESSEESASPYPRLDKFFKEVEGTGSIKQEVSPLSSNTSMAPELIIDIQKRIELLTKRVEALEHEIQLIKQHRGETSSELKSPSSTLQTSSNTKLVYVTKTGKKYHTTGCRYLKSVAGSMTKQEAEARGYTACSVCKP